MSTSFSPSIEDAIKQASARYGVPASRLRAFIHIESGGNPNARTGGYKGALQLSNGEFSKYGGGDIYSPYDNINAGALKLKAEASDYEKSHGRAPNDADLYMIHQQGAGGAAAHEAHPDWPAWESMYSTGEGRSKGPDWAKRAIWGNVPDDVKKQYGSVDNMTSKDFTDMWAKKVASFGGDVSGQQVAGNSAPSIPPILQSGYGRDSSTPGASAAVQTASAQPDPQTAFSPAKFGAGVLSGLSQAFSAPKDNGAAAQAAADMKSSAERANAQALSSDPSQQVAMALIRQRLQGAFA